MPRYRKKPVEIDAEEWRKDGDHPAVQPYIHQKSSDANGDRSCEHCGVALVEHGWIETLEGGHIVCPGDFVITGVEGERYPCKPGIFAKTYDQAGTQAVVRVAGADEIPENFDYPNADDIDIIDGEYLRVLEGEDVRAVFHRNHWSRVEIVKAES